MPVLLPFERLGKNNLLINQLLINPVLSCVYFVKHCNNVLENLISNIYYYQEQSFVLRDTFSKTEGDNYFAYLIVL